MFGHEIGFSQQLLPAEFVAVVDVGQQILDVEDSLDIVQILVADRNARETRSDDAFLDAQVVVAYSDGDDIHAGTHDLLHLGVGELDDAREHVVLLGRGGGGHVDGVGQLVERNLVATRGVLADRAARADQDVGEGAHQPAHQQDGARYRTGEPQGAALGEYLGDDLAEKQQQESGDDRFEEKAHAGRAEREEQVDDACGQDDDADVHQIVDHQNRSEQLIDVAEQPQNGVVRRFFGMCLDVPYVVRREREERRLGARNEGRDRQQAHRDRSRQEQTDVYGVECDQTAFQIRLFSFCTACRRISRRASRPSPAEVSPRRRPPP